MDTKPLLYGLIGFLIGGLLVSVAATTFDKPADDGMSMSQMTADLTNKKGAEFDKAFLEQMIVHHEGAVEMAKLAATNAERSEIKDMSKLVISAQTKEIDEMKHWQEDWGYKNGSTHNETNH